MVRILLILVAVGVLINALTFLMVAHYFSTRQKEAAAQGPSARSAAPAPEPGLNPELARRLTSLETSLKALSTKVDGIATRSVASSVPSQPRSMRDRSPGIRPKSSISTPAAETEPEEGEPPAGEAPAPAEPKKAETKPAPEAPPMPNPPAEGEKQEPPPAPAEGQTPPAPEGTPAPAEPPSGGTPGGADPNGGEGGSNPGDPPPAEGM